MMRPSKAIFVFCFIFVLKLGITSGHLSVPGLDNTEYVKLGDINIGFLAYFYTFSLDEFCSDIFYTRTVFRAEIIDYTMRIINERDDILPNITLGYSIQDDCYKSITSLARAVEYAADSWDPEGLTSSRNPEQCPSAPIIPRRIVGVVGPLTSRQAVMVSSFLGLFHIPTLSPSATSDELSDKTRFEYFRRLVAPDAYQSKAIVDILLHFEWTYVSLLYSEGSYGENAAKQIEKLTSEFGICLAFSHKINTKADEEELNYVIEELTSKKTARVIIFFASRNHIKLVFKHIELSGLTRKFLWIVGDSMQNAWPELDATEAITCLYIGLPRVHVPGFKEHVANVSCVHPENPWMAPFCEQAFGCTWTTGNNQTACESITTIGENIYDELDVPGDAAVASTDGILVYAHALHNLILNTCPDAFRNKSLLNNCVSGNLLLQYMNNVSVEGFRGDTITFNDQGDMLAKYTINQLQKRRNVYLPQQVGHWDGKTGTISVNISFMKFAYLDYLNESTSSYHQPSYPTSVCSTPCGEKEYYQRLELPCCWECHICRENEKITQNHTRCEICDLFTWPDNETATKCVALATEYFFYSSPSGIVLFSISTLGILLWLIVTVVILMNFKKRLIKASSRELGLFILCGTCLAFIVSFAIATKPSKVTCTLRQVGFHLSVTLIYAPLLIKSVRIYRIFAAGRKGNSRPRFVSSPIQLMLLTMVLVVQIIMLIAIEMYHPSSPKRLMPVPTIAYVELTCAQPLWAFLVPLCYNTCIIVVCGVFGFLTRKLPENFNDSWFIFISVSTTLFMWIVFIPTYFTMFYAVHQAALLAVCLVMMALITLSCQFVPKVYAVYYVQEERMKFSTATTSTHVEPSAAG